MRVKPFIKWAGGKTQLLPQLFKVIPSKFNNYFEPFIGGGALFFALGEKLEKKELYINDINTTLIGTYKNIQQNTGELIANLKELEKEYSQKEKDQQKKFYYEIRMKYNNKFLNANDIQKSTYFLFLNKTGYNGMYRENAKGEFNIPIGRYNNPKICDEKNLWIIANLLQSTHITNTSFEKAISAAQKGDLIYFDPPYHPISRTSSFTRYHETDFGEAEQQQLQKTISHADKKGCFIILSNSNTEFIKNLYKDYKQIPVQVNRFVNSKGTGRKKISELIITNCKQ